MEALNGLTYKGTPVIAHDEIKPYNDSSKRYIVLSGQSFTETSIKCGPMSQHLISLNIVCKYVLGSGTKKDVEEIANEILSRVYPSTEETGIVIDGDFGIWKTRMIGNRNLVEETSDERIITKIITFQHEIEEY